MKKNNAFETRDTGNKGLSGIKTEGAVMRACGPLALNTCGLPQMGVHSLELLLAVCLRPHPPHSWLCSTESWIELLAL